VLLLFLKLRSDPVEKKTDSHIEEPEKHGDRKGNWGKGRSLRENWGDGLGNRSSEGAKVWKAVLKITWETAWKVVQSNENPNQKENRTQKSHCVRKNRGQKGI